MNNVRMKHANSHSKKTRRKETKYKRVVRSINKRITKENNQNIDAIGALHLLHDPQGFADKLFQKLKSTNERFEVRITMMDVISRCIGANHLTILGFYPFIQKYLEPHQLQITKILAISAQAVHETVPPEVLHPLVMTIANNFANDRSASEVITVGLNTIREICARQPLVMRKTLLRDLAQYSKHKNKSVFHAARGIVTLFREVAPKMLKKKDRGRNADLTKEMPTFGENSASDGLRGIELLEELREKVGEITDKTKLDDGDDNSEEREGWIDVSDDEDEEDDLDEEELQNLQDMIQHGSDDEEQSDSENGDNNDDVVMDLNDVEQMLNAGEFDDMSDDDDQTNEDGDEQDEDGDNDALSKTEIESEDELDEEEREELRKAAEEKKEKIASLSATKILTQKEFELMRQLELRAKVNPKKRKEVINPDSLAANKKKRKRDNDDQGENLDDDVKQKWKKPKKKAGGQTQYEKKKNKPFQMIQQSKDVRRKNTMGQTQKRVKKVISDKRKLKHALKFK
jgi:protein SDA1